MKFFLILALAVAACLAAPAEDATVVKFSSDVGVDNYAFDVETSDGKKHSESGKLENPGAEDEAIAVTGSFSYVGDDGVTYTVTYVADKNGFQPSGVHLPVAPEA